MYKFLRTKAGFTLVEMLVIVVILGILVSIGVPLYRGVVKNARIKVCSSNRREIVSDITRWCTKNRFNDNYSFTITTKNEKGKVVAEPAENVTLITNEVFEGDVPNCPSSGTYTITMEKTPNELISSIKVTCSGGNDGDVHK